MTDDHLREFHLDGKQLVFLVISGIGVAVVVFLCGVMVGRGIPASASQDVSISEAAAAPADGPLTLGDVSASTGDTRLPSPDVYPERPGGAVAPQPLEDPVPPRVEPAAPATTGNTAKAPAPVATSSPPSSRGNFAVQVMSLKGRNEADTVVRSLNGKGYSAFVVESFEGGHWYRVRVGGFADKDDATAAAARLKKEQNFKSTWVVSSP